MSISAFVDRGRQPTQQEILSVLGSKRPLWEGIARFLADNYRASEAYKYYGKNYGWMVSFRRGSKAIAAMYPRQEGLVVQLILGETQTREALELPLPEHFQQAIHRAHPYPEGRWIFLEVTCPEDVEQIEKLLLIKAQPPRRMARLEAESSE